MKFEVPQFPVDRIRLSRKPAVDLPSECKSASICRIRNSTIRSLLGQLLYPEHKLFMTPYAWLTYGAASWG